MLGKTHATSGVVAGLAMTVPASVFTPLGPLEITAAAVFTAGAAMLPDLDHPHATAAHTFGPVTKTLGKIIQLGGHRNGTHSIVGIAAFTLIGFAVDTAAPQWALFPLLWLLAAVGADPFVKRRHHLPMLLATGAVAAAGTFLTSLPFGFVPAVLGVGAAAHILGDAMTEQGVPLMWPLSGRNIRVASINTDEWVEHRIVFPALLVLGVVAAWAAYV